MIVVVAAEMDVSGDAGQNWLKLIGPSDMKYARVAAQSSSHGNGPVGFRFMSSGSYEHIRPPGEPHFWPHL